MSININVGEIKVGVMSPALEKLGINALMISSTDENA